MNDFLRRRAASVSDNTEFSPEEAIRLALSDLQDGEITAHGVVIYFFEKDKDRHYHYHAYRGSLPIEEEVLLLTAELDRAVERWRGYRREEVDGD